MTFIEHLTIAKDIRLDTNRKFGDKQFSWLSKYRDFENGILHRHTIARILLSIVADTLLGALLN
jgi:hypothetical protein